MRARCVPSAGGPRWVRCGRASCSHRCRRLWAKKLGGKLRRRGEPEGSRVHVVIRNPTRGSIAWFRKQRSRAIDRIRRRLGSVAYLWVAEWSPESGYHEHALFVSPGPIGELFDVIREAFGSAGLEARVSVVREWVAVVKYIIGDLNDPVRWASPTPPGFRGRLYGSSRGFPQAAKRGTDDARRVEEGTGAERTEGSTGGGEPGRSDDAGRRGTAAQVRDRRPGAGRAGRTSEGARRAPLRWSVGWWERSFAPTPRTDGSDLEKRIRGPPPRRELAGFRRGKVQAWQPDCGRRRIGCLPRP